MKWLNPHPRSGLVKCRQTPAPQRRVAPTIDQSPLRQSGRSIPRPPPARACVRNPHSIRSPARAQNGRDAVSAKPEDNQPRNRRRKKGSRATQQSSLRAKEDRIRGPSACARSFKEQQPKTHQHRQAAVKPEGDRKLRESLVAEAFALVGGHRINRKQIHNSRKNIYLHDRNRTIRGDSGGQL